MADLTKISKYLSYILRHKPESIGLALSKEGWLSIDDLITASAAHGTEISMEIIQEVALKNDKQRFAISTDTLFIRANQGHSISVEVELKETNPPDLLYHGTVERFLPNIRKEGLQKMKRLHVHLSDSENKAHQVGMRRGLPVILTVKSGVMYQQGRKFFLSANSVWLTDSVPSEYIIWSK